MSILTKAQAKNFAEMDDFMLELCDFLKSKGVIDAKIHRSILLKGFSSLVDYLQEKKVISAKEAKEAMEKGYTSLVNALAK
ncbi:MAG: hypothetical protein NTZ51_05125 [Proteobacteria bacterium]|nr:hypothetical protein [Pseudomonadota bacterium]